MRKQLCGRLHARRAAREAARSGRRCPAYIQRACSVYTEYIRFAYVVVSAADLLPARAPAAVSFGRAACRASAGCRAQFDVVAATLGIFEGAFKSLTCLNS